MTNVFRAGESQTTRSNNQKEAWSVVSIGPSTRSEMHELGNLILALQFCLRRLGGRQSTDELEGLVRTGLEVSEQGIAAFRRLDEAVSARNGHLGEDISSQARCFEMRAAEYRAIADQMQNRTARVSYRHLAETYEAMGRRFRAREIK